MKNFYKQIKYALIVLRKYNKFQVLHCFISDFIKMYVVTVRK